MRLSLTLFNIDIDLLTSKNRIYAELNTLLMVNGLVACIQRVQSWEADRVL